MRPLGIRRQLDGNPCIGDFADEPFEFGAFVRGIALRIAMFRPTSGLAQSGFCAFRQIVCTFSNSSITAWFDVSGHFCAPLPESGGGLWIPALQDEGASGIDFKAFPRTAKFVVHKIEQHFLNLLYHASSLLATIQHYSPLAELLS